MEEGNDTEKCTRYSFGGQGNLQNADLVENSCGYLVRELKLIWDEVGQDQIEREKILQELKQECLEIFKKKVENANNSRATLHQSLADHEAEYTRLLVLLGEPSLPERPDQMVGTLKEKLDLITPALHEMRHRKEERVNQFLNIQMQIQRISAEIAGKSEKEDSQSNIERNENDLSLKKLEEYQFELRRLNTEKNDRLLKIENYAQKVNNLSAILGMDSSKIIASVHPSLEGRHGQQFKNIGDDILAGLNSAVESLEAEKKKRLEKIHKLGETLANLWNLMDIPYDDRIMFSHINDLLSVPAAKQSSPGSLSLDTIHQAETEVERLDQLKAGKMKEIYFKKRTELEEICKRTHMEMPLESEMNNILNLINSGEIHHSDLLANMDDQIFRAKEEASSRKAIMEKVERWMLLRDEERWLEEYNMDENRYSVSKGAHKNLKRAERARLTVNKIPALVASLRAMTRSWEEERKKAFFYDELPLLAILEDYDMSMEEKEEEKRRQRDKKRVQFQVAVGQENLFATRPPTSSRRLSVASVNGGFGSATPTNRRLSMGIHQVGSKSINSSPKGMSLVKESKRSQQLEKLTL